MKRKIIFGVEVGLAALSFIVWMIITILFFGSTAIEGFHANLAVEPDSTKRISSIPGLSTISDVGIVMVFISAGLLTIYAGCLAAMYFVKVKSNKIFYANVAVSILLAVGIILGILFICLKL